MQKSNYYQEKEACKNKSILMVDRKSHIHTYTHFGSGDPQSAQDLLAD